MTIQYKIKGITLDVCDLVRIHEYYQAACTAEYIMDNYNITDEDQAMHIGYMVRELMDDRGYDEEEAIEHIMTEVNMA